MGSISNTIHKEFGAKRYEGRNLVWQNTYFKLVSIFYESKITFIQVKGVVLVFVGTCMQTMAGFSNRP